MQGPQVQLLFLAPDLWLAHLARARTAHEREEDIRRSIRMYKMHA